MSEPCARARHHSGNMIAVSCEHICHLAVLYSVHKTQNPKTPQMFCPHVRCCIVVRTPPDRDIHCLFFSMDELKLQTNL